MLAQANQAPAGRPVPAPLISSAVRPPSRPTDAPVPGRSARASSRSDRARSPAPPTTPGGTTWPTQQHQRPRERPRHRHDHRPAHAAGGGPAEPAQDPAEHPEGRRSPRSSALNTDTRRCWPPRPRRSPRPATWQTLKATVTSTGVTRHRRRQPGGRHASRSPSTSWPPDHQLGFADRRRPDRRRSPAARVKLTSHDGTVHDIATGGGTLTEVVDGDQRRHRQTGVTATAVKVDDGSYRLLVQSTTTGADTDFTLTDADGTDLLGGAAVRAGADAQVSLGARHHRDVVDQHLHRPRPRRHPHPRQLGHRSARPPPSRSRRTRRTVAGARQGPGRPAQRAAHHDRHQDRQQHRHHRQAGVLAGDAAARGVRDQLLNTVFGDRHAPRWPTLGIQTDRYGKLVFDEATFAKAYAADPAARRRAVHHAARTGHDGWAARRAGRREGGQRPGRRHHHLRDQRPHSRRSTGSATTSTPGTSAWSCGARR